MQTKYMIIAVVVAVCIGGGAFYGGMQYEKSVAAKTPVNVRNFAGGNRQGGGDPNNQSGQRGTGSNGGMRRGGSNGGGFAFGEILSKDDKSVTIKTPDGGSKVVYFSAAMSVGKTETGSISDLITGQQVIINGKNNPDGSLSADTFQITPRISR